MFKINNLKTITMLILSIIVLASCHKDSPVTPSKSKAEMLVGSWKLDSSIAPDMPDYKIPEDYKIVLTYSKDRNFEILNNVYGLVRNGSWKMLENEVNVQMIDVKSNKKYYFSVINLNENKLQVQYFDLNSLFNDYYTRTNSPIP